MDGISSPSPCDWAVPAVGILCAKDEGANVSALFCACVCAVVVFVPRETQHDGESGSEDAKREFKQFAEPVSATTTETKTKTT